MERWVKSVTCVFLISLILCGCGEGGIKAQEPSDLDAAAGTEIEVMKDSSIVETMNEEFGEEYYDETNLRDIRWLMWRVLTKARRGKALSWISSRVRTAD